MTTEVEWLNQWVVRNPEGDWIEFLSERGASARKFRLFSCASCRLVWHLLTYAHAREAVEVAERFADGLATEAERDAAEVALYPLEGIRDDVEQSQPAYWAALASSNAVWSDPRGNHGNAQGAGYIENNVLHAILASEGVGTGTPWQRRSHEVSKVFLPLWGDIFGNCFRPIPAIDPSWLRWNDGTVARIAQGIYEERAFDRLPILADALLDAGCDNDDMLAHCRQQGGVHVRGCWVLDLLLGKE